MNFAYTTEENTSLFGRPEVIRIKWHLEDRYNRLNKMNYRKKKRILELEEMYVELLNEDWDEIYSTVLSHEIVKKLIDIKTAVFVKRWGKKRLLDSDFRSVFNEKAWIVCRHYDWTKSKLFLYEHLDKGFDLAGIELVRSCTKRDKRKANHVNVQLIEDWSQFRRLKKPISDFEDDVLTRVFINQVCNQEEQRLVFALMESPSLSYRDLAAMFGYNHPQTVKRKLDRIREKIKENWE